MRCHELLPRLLCFPNTSETLRNLSSILDELELNELEEGLQLLGAEKHLGFQQCKKAVDE
jgi:hypothetical protein